MRRIYHAMLRAQLRALGPIVGLALIGAIALPLATVQGTLGPDVPGIDRLTILLNQSDAMAVGYLFLALCTGGFLGIATWHADVLARCVYALTLPIPRWQYAATRFLSGLTLLLPVGLGLLLAALLASAMVSVPPAIVAHPFSIAIRFMVAGSVVFAAVSLIGLSGRKAWFVPVAFGALMLLAAAGHPDLLSNVIDTLFLDRWSPFRVLWGPWNLFDV